MKQIGKKIITLIITLFVVSFVTFFLFDQIPSNPALAMLGTNVTEERLAELEEQMGLNDPFFNRYGNFLKGLFEKEGNVSYTYQVPASELIQERLPITFTLMAFSFLITLAISIPFGMLAGRKKHSKTGGIITVFSQLIMSIPPFFLGILLTILFGLVLNWIQVGNYVSYKENKVSFFTYMILPAISVSIPKIAMVIKFLRVSMLEQMKQNYVITAKGKGLSSVRILTVHVLKNALIPVLTIMGMIVGDLLAGSIVVEQVFNIPGLGRLLVTSIGNRDYPVVSTIIVFIASVVMIAYGLIDILYIMADPRMRREETIERN